MPAMPLPFRPTLLIAAMLSAAGTASAQIATGALAGNAGNNSAIIDTHVAHLIRTHVPGCNKKLLIMTQCYGGNFIDEFSADASIAIASATSEGELSHYNTYDLGAALSLRPEAGHNAQVMHTEAIAIGQSAATLAGIVLTEVPDVGGGLALVDYPLEATTKPLQQAVHILFYAGKPEEPDVAQYWIIRELYPHADIVVVASGPLMPVINYPSTKTGLEDALMAMGQRMGNCNDFFIMFVGDHGHQIWDLGTPYEIFLQTQIPTPALPQSVADDLNGTPDPAPMLVLFLPYPPNSPPFPTPPAGPAPFDPDDWSVSVPLSAGNFEAMGSRQMYDDGGNGIVGDGPNEGVRVEFDMAAAQFIDAYVGHTNLVTVTNGTGQARTIQLILDPGPVSKVYLPDPCPAITTQPASAAGICPSGSAAFAVAASGAPPLTYEWQIQTGPGVWATLGNSPVPLPCGGTAQAIPPDTATTQISIAPCTTVNTYQLRCVVANNCGDITSDEATYVVCYANCDCTSIPPILNVADFICFLNKFAAADPSANCDGLTTPPILNVNDFICFQNKFAAGCP